MKKLSVLYKAAGRIILLLPILLSISGIKVIAQVNRLDSLSELVNKHLTEDTIRLNLLNALALQQSSSDYYKGRQIASTAVALAKKLNNLPGLAAAYNNMGDCFFKNDENDSCGHYYRMSMNIYSNAGDKFNLAKAYSKLAAMYMRITQTDSSLKYNEMALPIFEELSAKENIAGVLNDIGANYYKLSDIPNALKFYFKALNIYETIGSEKNIALSMRDIGSAYRVFENVDKALQFQEKSLAIYTKLNDKNGMAKALASLANLYDEQNDSLKTIHTYLHALRLNEEVNNKAELATNLLNIGLFYYYKDDFRNALSFLKKSIHSLNEVEDKNNTSVALCFLGSTYRKAPASFLMQEGTMPSSRFKIAYKYYDSSLAIAKKFGSLVNQAYTLGEMYEGYVQQNNYKSALEAYTEAIVIKDSMINSDKEKEIAKLELQNAFDKKAALIKSENEKKQILAFAEIRNQRTIKNSVIGAAGIIIIAGFAGFVFYKRHEDTKRQKISAEFNAKVVDTEMKALRSQMNPHFIFNSLNSISDYISKKDTHSADIYLTKFAKVMRMILENSEKKEICLKDDLRALELYMQLETLRLNNKFTYEIKVDERIDKENTLVPPLILQPFVENSIWHGLANKNGEGHILINIKKEGNMINCVVEDNGIGRANAVKQSHANIDKKSLGMKITKSRIDIINKLKNANAAVSISDLAEGMRAEVKLPLELSF